MLKPILYGKLAHPSGLALSADENVLYSLAQGCPQSSRSQKLSHLFNPELRLSWITGCHLKDRELRAGGASSSATQGAPYRKVGAQHQNSLHRASN